MTDLLMPCRDCGELSDQARCIEHRPARPHSLGTARERGYNKAWDKLSARARRMQPFCSDCGRTDDLQADHSPEAWERRERGLPIRLQDIDVVCGDCNRRRGQAKFRRDQGG